MGVQVSALEACNIAFGSSACRGAQRFAQSSPSDGELGTASKPPKSRMSFPKKVLSKSNTCRQDKGNYGS